jgi:hypothetical protein
MMIGYKKNYLLVENGENCRIIKAFGRNFNNLKEKIIGLQFWNHRHQSK